MRLDKYLKVSRIIKRRTVAKEQVDGGFVFLNSKVAKASSEVKINDIITLVKPNKKYKVVAIYPSATEEKALTMYEEIKWKD